MKVYTNKGLELEITIEAGAIDFHSAAGLEASFSTEFNNNGLEITVEDVRISEQRKGIYSTIIDTLLLNDDFHDFLKASFEEDEEEVVEHAVFFSVLRSEEACNFWLKRGYGEAFNEHDHSMGQQEPIEIGLF